MFFKELEIINLKNILNEKFIFNKKVNIFCGKNGAGKTSVLEAIHYIAMTKSFLTGIDYENINEFSDFFIIKSIIFRNEVSDEFFLRVTRKDNKTMKHNGKEYNKLSDHIGKIPVVVISPLDFFLIHNGSENRRKLMDLIISQYNNFYLNTLIKYNKVLKQRNMLLKNEIIDYNLLEVYNTQLCELGNYIFNERKKFLSLMNNYVFNIFNNITSSKLEHISFEYKSQLHEKNFETLLSENINKDKEFQTTTCGVHKDDLIFMVNNKNIKYSSQGQQKTFLISLKISITIVLKEILSITPFILVDDTFEKLDNERIENLFKFILGLNSQVFLTHTNKDEILSVVVKYTKDFTIFVLNNGKIEEIYDP
ncbi:MAG: DNA replication and repair protein RecF [Bacteroidales bacterium]|nr:DNA replication and repair protein RecF [Bacteroidales bacterium]